MLPARYDDDETFLSRLQRLFISESVYCAFHVSKKGNIVQKEGVK